MLRPGGSSCPHSHCQPGVALLMLAAVMGQDGRQGCGALSRSGEPRQSAFRPAVPPAMLPGEALERPREAGTPGLCASPFSRVCGLVASAFLCPTPCSLTSQRYVTSADWCFCRLWGRGGLAGWSLVLTAKGAVATWPHGQVTGAGPAMCHKGRCYKPPPALLCPALLVQCN